MVQFAKHIPLETPRILLADFNNDTVGSSIATINAFWEQYRVAFENDHTDDMKRWTLNGVRLDTSGKLRDASLDDDDPKGVNPVLVRTVRQALNNAWQNWDLPEKLVDVAKNYCQNVQIIVTGGFNREKIEMFERSRVPADAYGVGSTFLSNAPGTNTDFTMDLVRVWHNKQWHDMAKIGRRPCDNPDLRRVDLSEL